jgi:formylglycine-generating enzyme required for sulfatase activity
MELVVLRCVGRATLRHARRALVDGVSFGEAVHDIAADTLTAWRAERPTAVERRTELELLLQSAPAVVAELAEQAALEEPELEVRRALADYLERLPGVMRRSLGRSDELVLERPEELTLLLPPRPPRFRAGDRPTGLDGLVLAELLGIGGFGEVWKANPAVWGPTPVALKFCFGPGAARLLGHEAALNRLMKDGRHPGIVPLRQAHLHVDPPCLEYEYVEGGDLAGLVRAWNRNPPPDRVEQSATLLHELAQALAFAHGLQPPVVHRDLKPSNVLLSAACGLANTPEEGSAKPQAARQVAPRVTDFGIGDVAAQHALGLSPSLRAALTTGLRGAHTPHYASPEQKRGDPADPRDDVYALGVIWYQLLTGHLNREPGPGFRRALEKRQVPEPIIALVHSCLKKAEQRLPSAAVLAREVAKLLPRPAEVVNSVGLRLTLVPAGTFLMGSPDDEPERFADEGPRREVEMTRPFYLGVFPVTQREYESVMGVNPSRFHRDNGGGPDHPVEQVSWDDAFEFCRRLSARPAEREAGRVYRLLSEAEWEYACRAGTSTTFAFGAAASSVQANFNGDHPCAAGEIGPYLARTSAVGSFAANAWGLYDMHGNVWEWCSDWFDERFYERGPGRNPLNSTATGRRSLRGGAWNLNGAMCRSASRLGNEPGFRPGDVGFRVVWVPGPEG